MEANDRGEIVNLTSEELVKSLMLLASVLAMTAGGNSTTYKQIAAISWRCAQSELEKKMLVDLLKEIKGVK